MKLELTIDQVNIVLAGLAELPLKVSGDTFISVRGQADAHVKQEALNAAQPEPELEP